MMKPNLLLPLTFLLSLAFASTATRSRADELLIREVEQLRNMLSVKDPTRPTLTLRLADLLFDHVNELNKNSLPHEKMRTRAITLYLEALNGTAFQQPATGTLKLKIQFQLARLYADQHNSSKAVPLWTTLYEQNDLPELRREAALRLAEYHELDHSDRGQKTADIYYQKAIELCPSGDTCHYPHYRRAWLFHKNQKHDEALRELELALFDSKLQVREEALRDYLLFWAQVPGDGKKGILAVEALSTKIARPALLKDLSDAFFAAGNKVAAVAALEVVNARDPQFFATLRLIEEYYGMRRWDDLRVMLEKAQHILTLSQDYSAASETEKILQRITVQLDGERVMNPAVAPDFKLAVLLYLARCPNSPLREKMIDGWLAAETDVSVKLMQTQKWIATFAGSKEETHLHEVRASVAQQIGNHELVIEEMRILLNRPETSQKTKEYRYIAARALYELKRLDDALLEFRDLAKTDNPDRFAVQAQNLALDILAQQKKYSELMRQAELWINNPRFQMSSSLTHELADMRKVYDEARFENAALMGIESKEALSTFLEFCKKRIRPEKSCANARNLAIQQKNQRVLIEVLQLTKDTKSLVTEYEAAGFFQEAADLFEKTADLAKFENSLKLALLFELAENPLQRDLILRRLLELNANLSAEQEGALVQTAIDAGVITKRHLSKKLSKESRLKIAHDLISRGKGDVQIENMLLESLDFCGPEWSKLVLREATRLDLAQNKIRFYGKRGQTLFERRLNGLKKLVAHSEKYLHGADVQTRIELTGMLQKAHQDIAAEILSSPVPENLPGDALEQIKLSLNAMAEPFQRKADAYLTLLNTQKQKVESAPQAQPLVSMAKDDLKRLHRDSLFRLHDDPNDRHALGSLKTVYETRGNKRLALYFEGRMR